LSYRDGHFQELKVPLTWTVAVAVVVAAVIAVALLISDRRETLQASAYGAARAVVDKVDTPAGEAIAAPGRLAGEVSNYLKDYVFAASENRRLRQEVAQLQGLRDEAAALRNVNERYKALLGFRTEPPVPMVAARVVLDARGPFSDTRLADAGKERGVKVGDPVMSDRGLVGRVIGVTNGASRILLLTDVASRTPVLIDRTDARAILTGDSSSAPKLDYLRGQNPVRDGDRVLTSGDGGLEPRGLPVGTVVKGLDGAWRVQLDADESAIDFVRILLFTDFSALVDQKELAALPLPAGSAAPARPQTVVMAAPTPSAVSNPASAAGSHAGAAVKPGPAAVKPRRASVSASIPRPTTGLGSAGQDDGSGSPP
jgi:rod shape-determining protein MreC